MTQRVTVFRAAQLIGVKRGALQRLVQQGELSAPDGRIDIDELRRYFPLANLGHNAEQERVQLLRESSFARRVSERVLPTEEGLQSQIKRLRVERDLAREKSKLLAALINDLAAMLLNRQLSGTDEERRVIEEINSYIDQRNRG